jgi:hypothetical protein
MRRQSRDPSRRHSGAMTPDCPDSIRGGATPPIPDADPLESSPLPAPGIRYGDALGPPFLDLTSWYPYRDARVFYHGLRWHASSRRGCDPSSRRRFDPKPRFRSSMWCLRVRVRVRTARGSQADAGACGVDESPGTRSGGERGVPIRCGVPPWAYYVLGVWVLLTAIATTAQVPGEQEPRVRSVEVVGLDPIIAADRLPTLPLRPGTPYSLARLMASEHRIARILAELGHATAEIESSATISPDERFADVRLVVDAGPAMVFDTVFIVTDGPLSEAEVRRRLLIRTGEPVTASAIERSVERLRRLAIVERIEVDAAPIPGQETRLATRIAIATGPAQGPGLSGTFSSARCLEGRVRWESRHFIGVPRTFSVSGGGSNLLARPLRRFPCTGVGEDELADPDYFVRSELGQPLAPATWLFISAEVSRTTAARAYVRRGVQGRVAVAHELGTGWDGVVGYAPERSENPGAAPLLCALYTICGPQELAIATSATLHAPLELAAAWASPPVTGVVGAAATAPIWLQPLPRPWRLAGRAVLTVAGPASLSRFTYGSLVLDGSGARSLAPRLELAGRLRLGLLTDDGAHLPPQARLYGGGPTSVRGVAPNLLGPKILTMTRETAAELDLLDGLAPDKPLDPRRVRLRPTGANALLESSLELRIRAAGWLELTAFADYGVARSEVATSAAGRISRTESVWSPGVGALVVLPLGPLRVDLAYDPSPPRRYPVLAPGEDGSQVLLGHFVLDPFTFGDPSPSREFRRRLQLQLSVGHPF